MPGRLQRFLLGAALLIGSWTGGGGARAAEWRYCLAVAPAQHTVYMSTPFSDDESMETIESEFGRALDRAAMQHDAVQCPLGNAQSIAGMKAQAIQYNQASGNKVVQLNWRP
jgi:hypothetical protein